MSQKLQTPAPSDGSPGGIQLLASGDGMILRIEEDGHRIQRKLSAEETLKLLGNLAGVVKQLQNPDNRGKQNPIEQKGVLVLPNEAIGVGTNDEGNAVIGVSSSAFPTYHVPLTPEQTEVLAAALKEISELQRTSGVRH